jgi:hypothetical protein
MTTADTGHTEEDVAERLAALCADLLAEVRCKPFVLHLLSGPAGRWQLVEDLVIGLGDIQSDIAGLDRILSSQTYATWLEYPECREGPGYVAVMFFNEGGMSRIWIYHRDSVASSTPSTTSQP